MIGFGGFALARRKQIFPPALMDIFENVLWEEARHITFFMNWWRYDQAVTGQNNPLGRTYRALRYHVRAAMKTASGAQSSTSDNPPKLDLTGGSSQALLEGVTPKMFIELALAENRAMMERLDRRLFKPRIIPGVLTAALLGLRMLPPRPVVERSRPQLVAS